VIKELTETEEDFNRDMQFIVNTYLKHMDSAIMPKELRDQKQLLFGCFKEIADFHNNKLMKEIQNNSDPDKIADTFMRLQKEFDKHVAYCEHLPEALELLAPGPLQQYFDVNILFTN
jgi:PREDICTED: similar to ENSANGP00000021721